jgi:hypothetical protein
VKIQSLVFSSDDFEPVVGDAEHSSRGVWRRKGRREVEMEEGEEGALDQV